MNPGYSVGDFIALYDTVKRIRSKWLTAPDDYTSMKNVVNDVENVFAALKERQDDLTFREARSLFGICYSCNPILESCEKLIDEYAGAVAESGLGGGPGKRVRRAWKRLKLEPDDVRRVREQLSLAIAPLGSQIGMINSRLSSEIKENIVAVKQSSNQHERAEIAHWYHPSSFSDQYEGYRKQRQEGSGSWFLRDECYLRWRDDPRDASDTTMLCTGIPGAGKTYMATAVIQDIRDRIDQAGEEERSVVAYFYCNFKRHEQQELEHIYSALVRQLFQERKYVPQEVQTLYLQHRDRQTRPSVNDLSALIRVLARAYRRTYIVIDALDECNVTGGTRRRFLEELFTIQRSAGNVNILATSRVVPEVLQTFKSNINIEIRATKDDIESYLDHRMSELEDFVSENVDLQEAIKSQISSLVNGMFLLAKLHFESLIGYTTASSLREALEQLPSGQKALDEAYDDVRERIDHQLRPRALLARHVFAWVTFAKRELSMRELQEALAITMKKSKAGIDPAADFPKPDTILSVCEGLVTVDPQTTIVRLVHYTTKDYIEKVQHDWLPTAPADLARTCIDYLGMYDFVPLDITWRINTKGYYKKYALLPYVGRYIGEHVKQAADTKIQDLIVQFLCDEKKVCFAIQATWQSHESQTWRRIDMANSTALHLCAFLDLAPICSQLLKIGHGSVENDCGELPLHVAAECGGGRTLDVLLLESGTDVNATDRYGRTALIHAAWNGHKEVVEVLLRQPGIDVNAANSDGGTALSCAAEDGHKEVVEMLLCQPGIDVNAADSDGWTALLCAMEDGHKEVVEMLLCQPGIDANAAGSDGMTALMHAAWNGHKEVVEVLLRQPGIDVNAAGSDGWTALLYAAEVGHKEVVEVLLRQPGIDVNAASNDGWRALTLAICYHHKEVVDMLLRHPDIGTHIPGFDRDFKWSWESDQEWMVICKQLRQEFPQPSWIWKENEQILFELSQEMAEELSISVSPNAETTN